MIDMLERLPRTSDWRFDHPHSAESEWIEEPSSRLLFISDYRARRNLPPNIDEINQILENSRVMLSWPDDWDEDGSPGYCESTWRRAKEFLVHSAVSLWRTSQIVVHAPTVTPGPDGSFDIDWRSDRYHLLVNVPSSLEYPITYYGHKTSGEVVKGNLDTSQSNEWLTVWLSE